MKHAGLPWEVGLAEAHQTLLKNNLRHRVKLQVDGQLRTGRDIVIAAMLGADEFAFGTSMLVSLGCVQCRNCNLNCCPVGIATQKAELRCKFAGKPEHLRRYFRFLAQEVREYIAALGVKSLAEVRGRVNLLKTKDGSPFDFGDMLTAVECEECTNVPSAITENYDCRELIPHVKMGENVVLDRAISNRDRSVGAALSGFIAKERLEKREGQTADGRITVNFAGVAGQSFGAFLAKGVTFNLRGEANDYVGKGLSVGEITIAPPTAGFAPEDNVIAGNVIAYGATSGGGERLLRSSP